MWADLFAVHGEDRTRRPPALCLGASSAVRRATSPFLVRGPARLGSPLLRIDVEAVRLHYEWLDRERDPDRDRLISIIHPDESGLDDSPKYDGGTGA